MEVIAEAATRPTMRFVTLKSEDQLDLQTLHRVRDRLVEERTALINQLRALLYDCRRPRSFCAVQLMPMVRCSIGRSAIFR